MSENDWFYYPPLNERLGIDNEEYEKVYGYFNYSGSIVLDAGADWGTTAKFFISKGAKKIIAIEQADIHFKNLCENAKRNNKIIPLHLGIHLSDFHNNQNSLSITWEKLIFCFEPDFIKADVELAERYLVDVPNKLFKKIKGLVIECHGEDIEISLTEKLLRNGFNIIGKHRDSSSIYWVVSFGR